MMVFINGGTPIAGKILLKWMIWKDPCFRKPPYPYCTRHVLSSDGSFWQCTVHLNYFIVWKAFRLENENPIPSPLIPQTKDHRYTTTPKMNRSNTKAMVLEVFQQVFHIGGPMIPPFFESLREQKHRHPKIKGWSLEPIPMVYAVDIIR